MSQKEFVCFQSLRCISVIQLLHSPFEVKRVIILDKFFNIFKDETCYKFLMSDKISNELLLLFI